MWEANARASAACPDARAVCDAPATHTCRGSPRRPARALRPPWPGTRREKPPPRHAPFLSTLTPAPTEQRPARVQRGRRQRSFLERCPRPCDAARRGVLSAPGRWWRASRAPPPVGLLARAQLTRDLAAGDRARGLLLTSDMRHVASTLRPLLSLKYPRGRVGTPHARTHAGAAGWRGGLRPKVRLHRGGGIAPKGGVQQGVQKRGAGHVLAQATRHKTHSRQVCGPP